MLYEFIAMQRGEIIRRCKVKVASRSIPGPTSVAIEHGVPLFLDQLVAALRLGRSSSREIKEGAILQGHDLLTGGFSISQVVHNYGDVCQSITELANETDAPISANEFRLLNGCLDVAIAGAVTEYSRKGLQKLAAVEAATAGESERFGCLTYELRDLIHAALIAFEMVKVGHVGVGGSTSRIIDRALLRARDLIARSLAATRLAQDSQIPERVLVAGFIDGLAETAILEANSRGVNLKVVRGAKGAVIQADQEVLGVAVMILLQNALRFTRPETTVTLRVRDTVERVLVEIQDECGGLPAEVETQLRPIEQPSGDHTGLGLGLAFTRKAITALGGRVSLRNLPHAGCLFTVDLPRVQGAAEQGNGDRKAGSKTTAADM